MRTFPAHRYRRGGFTVFVLAMPLRAVTELLPVPDPERKFPGNRRVDPQHAADFAAYWMSNRQWATPPLLVDTATTLGDRYERVFSDGATDSGRLNLTSDSARDLEILDGQHRILGWFTAAQTIRTARQAADREILLARAAGNLAQERRAEAEFVECAGLDGRLDAECVTVELFEGVSLDEHRQFFSDIATNAKGITKSQVAAFDQRDLVNRVAAEIAGKHPLVEGSVDFEKDRMTGASANLLSAKTLVDIIRASAVGPESRATRRVEALLAADDVREIVLSLLDVLVDEVPGLADVASGRLPVATLREQSLIASGTVLRCLAGAFRMVSVVGIDELRPRVDPAGEYEFRRMLRELVDGWGFPVDGRWRMTGCFPSAVSRAPSSRAQDLKALTVTLANWARMGVPARPWPSSGLPPGHPVASEPGAP